MAMTPEAIRAAADYFSTKNTARLGSVLSAAQQPKATGGGGYSNSGGGGSKPGTRKPVRIGAPANPPEDGGFDVHELIENVVKGIPILGSWLTVPASYSEEKGATSILDDAMAERDAAERPENATQRVMDFLSGPFYAAAGAAHEIGEQSARGEPADPMAIADAVNTGLNQGLGLRPGSVRPYTHSRNLNEAGVLDLVRDAGGAVGLDPMGQDVAAGTVGFLADAAGDPTMWIPGIGLTKALPGAAQGASAAIKAGKAGNGVKFGDVLGGAGEGFVGGLKEARTLRLQRAEAIKDRKATMRSGTAARTMDEEYAEEAAARAAAFATPAPTNAQPLRLMPDAPPVAAASAAATPEPTIFDDLLSQMSAPREVPANQILDMAAPVVKPRLVDETLDTAVRTAIYDTARVSDYDAALKQVRALPGGTELLNKRIRVDGKMTTVRATMERAAIRRITEDRADRIAPWVGAIEEVLKLGGKMERTAPTPQSLSAAVEALMPGVQAIDGAALLGTLREAAPGGQAAVRAALKAALEGGGTPYASFDEAIAAAVEGRVETSMMRSMLEALGIKSKAVTPAGLRAALAKSGKVRWAEIQNSVPTPQEALNSHGVTPEAAAAAAATDPAPIMDGAVDEFEQILETEVGFNPLVLEPTPAPTAAGTTGRMIRAGVQALDGLPTGPAAVEAFGKDVWLTTHRAMFGELGKAMNTARAGGKKGLTGAARVELAYPRWLAAMRAVTAHAVSRGMIPRLQYKPGTQPLYLSMDQIAEALPDEIIGNALFNLNYRLTKFGEGSGDAAKEQFKLGLSVYPTHIAEGARVAINGGTREQIVAAMSKYANAFEKSKNGKAAINDLAAAMDTPQFRTEMRVLHEAQEIAAVSLAMRAADNVVTPLAHRIVNAIARNGDRSTVLSAIDKAIDGARAVAPVEADSLVRELAEQRVQNGILASLDEVQVAVVRHDKRMNVANGSKSMMQQIEDLMEAEFRKATRKGADGTPVKPEILHGGANTTAKRASTAQVQRQLHDDLEEQINEVAVLNVADGHYEPTDIGYIQSMVEADQGLGTWSIFGKLGRGLEGSYGQGPLKSLQVQLQSGSFVHSHAYEKNLNEWLFGDRIGGTLGVGATAKPGVTDRLGQALGLGRPATEAEANTAIAGWWHALATHLNIRMADGSAPTDEYMEMALLQGARRNPDIGVAAAAPALSPAEAEMAMELYRHINDVFAPIDGPLARSGVTTADLMREMGRYGFHEHGPFANYMIDPERTVADQATTWAAYDTGLMNAPLDVLANWHKALSAASLRPALGSSISGLFDHVAEGFTRADIPELVAQGWRRIDTKRSDQGVGAYVDPESYFPPEVLQRITYLNNFLEQMAKPLAGGKLNPALRVFDATTGALKSSMTIWNPSHHVTNVLGESMMLIMAGVNPAQAIRSVAAIKAGGRMLDVSDTYHMNFLETADAAAQYNGKTSWASGNATVVIKNGDGPGQKVGLTPEQIWTRALNDGVALTARESKDMLPGEVMTNSNSRLSRMGAAVRKVNFIGKIDHKLGEFSAARDNMTRLAHYYHALENGTYRTLEEAFTKAAAEVHSYHPTIQTLGAFDQKVLRRVIFFHTWVRQAAGRVVQTMLEKPAYVTLPAKWQYAQAEAAGLEPFSVGKPFNGDPRIASYYYDGIYGPTFEDDAIPGGGLDDLAAGEDPHLWGYSLSSPQMDALFAFFGGIQMDEGITGGLGGFVDKQAQALNPLIQLPMELMQHKEFGSQFANINTDADVADYLFNQTGAPARLGNALGVTGAKPSLTDAENAANANRLLINYVTGLKLQDYTNTTSASIAKQEQSKWEREYLTKLGYSDEQIKIIREMWAQQRGY